MRMINSYGVTESTTAHIKGDFVVFHIGFSRHSWWHVRTWLPVAQAMGGMLRELKVFRAVVLPAAAT